MSKSPPPSHPSTLSALFPPSPTFTETSLPTLLGRVVIVTGAASGVGFELAKIVYLAGATVYIAARSTTRCKEALARILSDTTDRPADGRRGDLRSMVVDLADFASVKKAAAGFLKLESRLDVLLHNAGVMIPPAGSKGVQGLDLELTTNCLSPFLLTTLLSPLLKQTAALSSTLKDSVRVVFVTSLLQSRAPPRGMIFDKEGRPEVLDKPMTNYVQSKVGSAWLAVEFGNRFHRTGVVSVSLHPGFISTELQRYLPAPAKVIMGLLFKPAVYGAYSELYAAFSPDVTVDDNGRYLMAWGRKAMLPRDIVQGMTDGGLEKLVRFCEERMGASF